MMIIADFIKKADLQNGKNKEILHFMAVKLAEFSKILPITGKAS